METASQKAYSIIGESFTKELYDLLDDYFANDDLGKIPQEIEVFEGDAVNHPASKYFDHIDLMLDRMTENAWEQAEEWSDCWMDKVTPEQSADLRTRIRAAIDAWADQHNQHPSWFQVENIRKVTVNIDEVMGSEWRK